MLGRKSYHLHMVRTFYHILSTLHMGINVCYLVQYDFDYHGHNGESILQCETSTIMPSLLPVLLLAANTYSKTGSYCACCLDFMS